MSYLQSTALLVQKRNNSSRYRDIDKFCSTLSTVYIEMSKWLKYSPELNPDTKGRGANTAVMLFVDFTRYFAYVVERKINKFYFIFSNHHGKIFQLNPINLRILLHTYYTYRLNSNLYLVDIEPSHFLSDLLWALISAWTRPVEYSNGKWPWPSMP